MKKLLIALGIVAVLVVIVFAAVGRRRVTGESVYMGEVSRGDVVTVVTGTGVIQPRTRVNISSEIYGQIVAIPVKEGETVRKGDLLVKIDPDKYRSEVDRLAANTRVGRIAIESEEVGLRNLELEQRRANDLFEKGVVSISEKERADLAVDSSRIRLKSLRESVTQAEAGLNRAKVDLSKATIYAPMAGQVTQVNTEVGEQVIVGTTNIPGSVLMVISDMSEVLAEVNVDETEVVRLQPGQTAKVTADAVEKTTYQGRVTEIRNTAKKEGDVSVFGVKILLDSPDLRLRPGMTAKAKIEVERHESVLRVPIQAVTTRERKKLEDEQKAASSKVASGARPSSRDAKGGTKQTADASGSGEGDSRGVSETMNDGDPDAAGGRSKGGTASAESKDVDKDAKGDRDEIEVVYIVEKDVTRAVPVRTGATDESYVEIQDGVKEGVTVVTGPYRALKKLKEGVRVTKKEESDTSSAEGTEGAGGSNEGSRGE